MALILLSNAGFADPIIVQSTTSTQNSGLYEYLLPVFEDETGIEIRVVAVGTGQALKNAQNCDGDMLITHAKAAEQEFVAQGFGIARHDLMYNDFIIVGPANDPAGVAGLKTASDALTAIAKANAPFASRGDNSGTHQAELTLWPEDPAPSSGDWYLETGSGMGPTLNAAIGLSAYTLTDRATWVSFGNKGDHVILLEGDPALFNQYGVIVVNPSHCPNANIEDADTFQTWLLGPAGQSAIAGFQVDGQQLFTPNAANP